VDFVSWGHYRPSVSCNCWHSYSFYVVCLGYAGTGTFRVGQTVHGSVRVPCSEEYSDQLGVADAARVMLSDCPRLCQPQTILTRVVLRTPRPISQPVQGAPAEYASGALLQSLYGSGDPDCGQVSDVGRRLLSVGSRR
jgi:hypothetical protein